MGYKTTWFSMRDLVTISKRLDVQVKPEELRDTLPDGSKANGGYGANIEERLYAMSIPRYDIEYILTSVMDDPEC
jgi:hypothetical protein